MNQDTLFLLVLLLTIFDAAPHLFRKRWKQQEPLISSMQIALNNEADFLNLTLFSFEVFETKIVAPIKAILGYPRYQIEMWLHTDNDDPVFQKAENGRFPHLSVEDRVMRCIMFNRNNQTKLLEILWGQKKSIIYRDVWLIMRILCKVHGDTFKLPLKGTEKYLSRVGAGTLGDAFENAVYVMDGHEV